MLARREFLKLAGGGAAAAVTGVPAVLRAQGKGKVRLAYLQLGWAATEIIHKEDLLGRSTAGAPSTPSSPARRARC